MEVVRKFPSPRILSSITYHEKKYILDCDNKTLNICTKKIIISYVKIDGLSNSVFIATYIIG